MIGFDDIPVDKHGEPMLEATTEAESRRYIEWLADYLFRPQAEPGVAPGPKEATNAVIAIESDIAFAIWEAPFEDYPPADRLPPNGACHADILHRASLSEVLSRVPDRAKRINLLDRFYLELSIDSRK